MNMVVNQSPTIGFLLGSGVSLPCGAPSTADLTRDLLSHDIPYYRWTDKRYYRRTGAIPPILPAGVPNLRQIGQFIMCLARFVTDYYANRVDPAGCVCRAVNYEDLAYLAVQVSETINRERDNPALAAFVRDVLAEFKVQEAELWELADETIGLIADHVADRLSGLTPATDHLLCVREACGPAARHPVPILSLNHDCLIESMFRTSGMQINDMTRSYGDGRRILEFTPSVTGTNLFKLHGSIDWFRWRPLNPTESDGFWSGWVGALELPNDQVLWRHDSRAHILVGRFNKELSYADSPFAEVFAQARWALRTVNHLVVSGYSFGDKAVNTMLIDWMYGASKGSRKMLVAHENPESVRSGARGAIGKRWDSWINEGVLIPVTKYLGELSLKDIQAALAA
jgi:hypothetical protein